MSTTETNGSDGLRKPVSASELNMVLRATTLLLVFMAGFPAVAQSVTDPAQDEPAADPVETGTTAVPPETGSRDDAQDEEIRKLKEQVELLTGMVEEGAEEEFDLSMFEEEEEFEPSLEIFGFFDLNLRWYNPDDNSTMEGMTAQNSSFFIGNLNLYFKSHLTQNISALVEIGFTMMPHGVETSFEESNFFHMEYGRIDTTAYHPFTFENRVLGSIFIERAQLNWSPRDYFGVIAGRFLTPFGIWNVDHGTTVLLPVNSPFFMARLALPLAQTGLQVYGKFYPFRNTYLDYAITCSNGRGPTEAVMDFDQHKALGGRLKLTYEGRDISVATGGYLYWGKTTDLIKRIDSLAPLHIETEKVMQYDELTGSIDLLVKIFGLRLQSEYVRGRIWHKIPTLRIYSMGQDIPSPLNEHQPDFIKWGIYGLMAYEIPILTTHGRSLLTPYVWVEFYQTDDTMPTADAVIYVGGLNFKPIPSVVIKAELGRSTFPNMGDDEVSAAGGIWAGSLQLAVSF